MTSKTLILILALGLFVPASHAQVDFEKVMITEVAWQISDYLEITNFSDAPVDLTGWTVRWDNGVSDVTSSPLDVVIQPGQIIVLKSQFISPPAETPAGTTVLSRFANLMISLFQAQTIGLIDDAGAVVDEVRMDGLGTPHPGTTFGGAFHGVVTRSSLTGFTANTSVERIWGLDSDSGRDWTEQPNRSMGLQNRNSGPRGTDPRIVPQVKINEVDTDPDYVELRHFGTTPLNLQGWFFLVQRNQLPVEKIEPFPGVTFFFAGQFLVIGDGPRLAETPPGVQHVDTVALGTNLPINGETFAMALYTDDGILVDMFRATDSSSALTVDGSGIPAAWDDFVGTCDPINVGSGSFGRDATSPDTDTGADWYPLYERTMGTPNVGQLSSVGGHGDALDARVNATGLGGGLVTILNAGSSAAGASYGTLFSLGQSNGVGPFFGLAGDTLNNFVASSGVAPLFGILDAQGSARWDLPSNTVPPNLHVEFVYYTLNGIDFRITRVIRFDT